MSYRRWISPQSGSARAASSLEAMALLPSCSNSPSLFDLNLLTTTALSSVFSPPTPAIGWSRIWRVWADACEVNRRCLSQEVSRA